MTIKAMLVKSGYGDSSIYSGVYTITHTLATPTASPVAGAHTSSQNITLSGEEGSTIYYTTNGSTPTTESSVYSSAINVPIDTTMVIKALAVKSGYGDSEIYSGEFAITHILATPTASPVAGTFVYSSQNVSLSGEDGSTIYYTTNGSTPTTESSVYSSPINVPIDTIMNIKALAVKSGYGNSEIYSGTFTITHTLATPSASPVAGNFTSAQTITLTTEEGSTTYYTTNGSDPTIGSTLYSGSISVPGDTTMTLKAFSVKEGYGDSAVYSGGVYTTTHQLSTPTSSPSAGSFTDAQSVILSSEDGTTIYYTTNGSTPTTGSTLYSGAITVPIDTTMTIKSIATKNGYATSEVYSGTFVTTHTLSTPVASPAAGSYSSSQSVSLSAETGSTIYYTTNGSTPTTESSVYSSAITINSTTTLKAIAVKSGYGTSATLSSTYTINYILTYSAGAHGSISGSSPQSVPYNGNGTEVSAVADTGYHFVNWSDSVATAGRQDTAVANLSVTANFAQLSWGTPVVQEMRGTNPYWPNIYGGWFETQECGDTFTTGNDALKITQIKLAASYPTTGARRPTYGFIRAGSCTGPKLASAPVTNTIEININYILSPNTTYCVGVDKAGTAFDCLADGYGSRPPFPYASGNVTWANEWASYTYGGVSPYFYGSGAGVFALQSITVAPPSTG